MYHSRSQYISEERKAEITKHIIFLLRFSAVLKKGIPLKAAKLPTRFKTDECKAVVAKHHIGMESSILKAGENIVIGVTLAKAKMLVADQMKHVAVSICNYYKLKMPSQKSVQLEIDAADSLAQMYLVNLPDTQNMDCRLFLGSVCRDVGFDSFYINEVLYYVGCFMVMMNVLVHETPFKMYESTLKKQFDIEGWFTDGYPYHLLVHDYLVLVDTMRDREALERFQGIFSYQERCSTRTLLQYEKLDPCYSLRVA